MANEEALKILKRGGRAWNDWLRERRRSARTCKNFEAAVLNGYDLQGADLTHANLRGASLLNANLDSACFDSADLREACLRDADLFRASFMEADLREADFAGAGLVLSVVTDSDLSRANLSGAQLSSTRFADVNMREADLRGADLIGTIFEDCDFGNTNVSGAGLAHTTFLNVDLRGLIGLDRVEHFGPSNVEIDTLYRSGGDLSVEFLRAVGVPESLIDYLPSLVGSPIRFYSCFLSHSGKDRVFCDRLSANLRAKNVKVWYFPEDARWGRPTWREIDRNIVAYDKLIVVCSENSLESGPVLREIERALQREDREKRDILFPVRIDDYLFTRWEHSRKADVTAKVVGDFRGWDADPQKFVGALERLITALEATDG